VRNDRSALGEQASRTVRPRPITAWLIVAVTIAISASGLARVGAAATLQQSGAAARDPLQGEWETAKIPMSRIRSAVRSAGYTSAEIKAFLKEFGLARAPALRFNFTFYRDNGAPFVEQRGWNASHALPADSDHGPYRLLPKHRIVITSAEPKIHKYRIVFSYTVRHKVLRLRLVSSTNPGLTKKRLRLENCWLYAQVAASFRKH
jgi:hypothetical protein